MKGLREEIIQQKTNVVNLNNELKSLITKKNTLNINLELLKPKLERLNEKRNLLEIKRKNKRLELTYFKFMCVNII